MCSDQIATTFMDLNDFDVYGKIFTLVMKKTKNCVKNGSTAQNSQKIKAKVWRFSVLFTGFFGLQNRIFGKFVGFFIWKCLETPINDDEFLGNSMIRASDHLMGSRIWDIIQVLGR